MNRKTLAIPLRCVDFSNSSQVLSLFTREHGLIEAIAKGSHRGKNPFQGPFDLAVLYEAVFVERRSSGLAILTQAAVVEGFRPLRRRLDLYLGACHVLELLRAVATAGEPSADLFDAAVETLLELAAAAAAGASRPASLTVRFDVQALRILGLLAPMDSCVQCGRRRPGDRRPVFFSPGAGGIVCSRCRLSPEAGRGVVLPGGAIAFLGELARESRRGLDWSGLSRGWRDFGGALEPVLEELRTNLLERELVLLKSFRQWVQP